MLITRAVLPARFPAPKKFTSLCHGLLIVAASLLFGACGGSNDDSTMVVANPDVEGPIDGAPVLLGSTTFNLADVGYQQSEFFISGNAKSYVHSDGMQQSDGKWSVREDEKADYKTRILVYRPINAADFNGTIVVEWLNVSSGTEASSVWIMAHTELIRKGYAWVGVSAQVAGIEGGGANLGGLALYLKAIAPARYGLLVHPGDKYSYDIFSQAAQAVLHPHGVDPLNGLTVKHTIATGESQSADFMLTYVDALAPITKLFDGYFLHSRVHGAAGVDPVPLSGRGGQEDFGGRDSVRVRDDLDVPVMIVETETDMFYLGAYADRQPDSNKIRTWEVAGAAHADLYVGLNGATDKGDNPDIAAVVENLQPNPIISCDKPVNDGPQHFVVKAAVAALENWIRNDVAPATADRFEIVDGDTPVFVYDDLGNVKGGVRTPYVDVPVAKLSGEGQNSTNTLCNLFGTTALFDGSQLASLYPDNATFVDRVNTAVDSAVSQGFILQPDGDLIKTWAQNSGIGNP